VVEKEREKLAASKKSEQKFDEERCNFRKLIELKLGKSIRSRNQRVLLWRTSMMAKPQMGLGKTLKRI
jgi:hypothetical protein